MKRHTRLSFTAWEVALIVAFTVLAVLSLHHPKARRPFRFEEDWNLSNDIDRRYPIHFSNDREEALIRDFFHDERGGVFVDVGAYKWQDASNTYSLEHDLGWSGVAIDVMPDYAEGYRLHRPRTKYVVAFIDAVDGAPRTVFVSDDEHRQVTSSSRSFTASEAPVERSISVVSSTLNTVLTRTGITHMDFLNLDIELGEPNALRGFSIDQYRPRLVCVEQHPPVRQFLLEYFAAHGYAPVGKYLYQDWSNLYFAPIAPSAP